MNTIFFLIKFDIYTHYKTKCITTFIGLGHELQLQNKPRIKNHSFVIY